MKAFGRGGDQRAGTKEPYHGVEHRGHHARYFENDTGKSKGDLEYTIINSVKRYFEGKPPER